LFGRFLIDKIVVRISVEVSSLTRRENVKIVWLIRHGQTPANADENYRMDSFATPSLPLTQLGIKQAEQVVNYFNSAPDLIITSPYLRTKQTADLLIKRYPRVRKERWPITREFAYLSSEKSSNATRSEMRPRGKEYWDRGDPDYFDGAGAETFRDFIQRVRCTIRRLKNRRERFIILFGHEFFISAIRFLSERKPRRIGSKQMREFRDYLFSHRIPNGEKIELIL